MSVTSQSAVRGLCGTMLAVTTLATGLRLYSRRVQKSHIGVDDWMIVPAWLLFVGMTTCVLLGVQWSAVAATVQQEAATGTPAVMRDELFFAMDVQGTLSEACTRISALLFFRRIFCVSGRSQVLRNIIFGGIGLLFLWAVAFVTLPLMQCGPNLAVINDAPAVVAAHCTRQLGTGFVLSYTISNVIIEVAIIALPVPLVLRLHTTVQRRLAVLFVFATALLSLGANCARLAAAVAASSLTGDALARDNTALCFFWILGTGVALTAANMPTLFWVIQRIKPEKVLSGIRSAVSLRSLSSRGSRGSANQNTNRKASKSDLAATAHKPSVGSTQPDESMEHTAGGPSKIEDSSAAEDSLKAEDAPNADGTPKLEV